MKLCTKCKIEKDLSCFSKKKDKLQPHCKKCNSNYYKSTRSERINYRKSYAKKNKAIKIHNNINKKFKCTSCKITKAFSEFTKESSRYNGLSPKCKKCSRLKNKKYRKNNKNKFSAYLRKYRKEKPEFKLNENISRSIRKSLINGKSGKSWEDIVGYTANDLKKHLESLWEPWMNWDNYGNPNGDHTNCWHIDHVIPKSWFNYTSYEDPEFKACWALSNLQPKEAKENIIKNNNYIG